MTMTIQYHSIGGRIIGETSTGSARVDYLTDALGSVTSTVGQNAESPRNGAPILFEKVQRFSSKGRTNSL